MDYQQDDDRSVDLNAGIFIWPFIISVFAMVGLLFGYLFAGL